MASSLTETDVFYQIPDGCVAQSATYLFSLFGQDFKSVLKRNQFRLAPFNPNNIHMLGVAEAAVDDFSLFVSVHSVKPLSEYQLEPDTGKAIIEVHNSIITQLDKQISTSKLTYESGQWDREAFDCYVTDQLNKGRSGLVYLNWHRWAQTSTTRRVGIQNYQGSVTANDSHVICIFSIDDKRQIDSFDPSIQDPIGVTNLKELFECLNPLQQIIFVGHK